MAVGTRYEYTVNQQDAIQQVFYGTSASGAAQTVSTDTEGVRRIIMVTVKYSAAQTATVTCTLNANAGSGYDTLLQNISFANATDGVWIPDREVRLTGGDALDVVAPLLAAQTSAVQIYTEKL